ncbi:MAG: PilZ domain-containing protein [Candidatus Sulfotelmatobacter sp.]|jgi:CheY-like chemotaxis protein
MSERPAAEQKATSGTGKSAPAKAAGVRVLLVSDDIQTIDTLCQCMERMAMHVDVCSDAATATRKLCHSKFEALVVDLKDAARALELIKKPREMTAHKGVVVLAILNASTDMPSAFRAGASFALVKPFTPAILSRTLRASYPLMVRERRRSYRCPLEIPVNVSSSGRPDFVAKTVNISEGGMALFSSMILRVGERLTLKLALPDSVSPAKINSEVCWADETGRVGLEFVQVSPTVAEQLQSWLADRLEACLPC